MRFQGKVSIWFYGIMIFAAVVLIPIIVLAGINQKIFVLAFSSAMFVFIEIFCIPIAFRNYAELNRESLLIVFGFIRFRILYRDMEEIKTTKDPSSSLAASLDRIKIQYCNGKTVMIALQDQQAFYEALQKKKLNIKMT